MWDERYSLPDYFYGTDPNDFLVQEAQRLPRGQVLCIGDGEGRNGVYLAQQGYEVTSVDASAIGLEKARRLADERGVALTTVMADLTDYSLGSERWDGIVSIFCHLPAALRGSVHQRVQEALKPAGVFLVESYTPKQLEYGTGGPPNPEWLVTIEELQRDFSRFEWLVGRELEREVNEGTHHFGLSHVVQALVRKPG